MPTPLRIFIVADRRVRGEFFSVTIRTLAERGHEVHVCLTGSKHEDVSTLLETLRAGQPNITYSKGPHRRSDDGWRRVAWTVRVLQDLAHHSHPRYDRAGGLRSRMKRKALKPLEEDASLEPVGHWLAVRAGRRMAAHTGTTFPRLVRGTGTALEEAIPSSPEVEAAIREFRPDIVVATGTVWKATEEVDFVKAARKLGIPTGMCVCTWDSLTNKGLLKGEPDRVFVWNESQVDEATTLHGIPPEKIRATGAPVLDKWFGLSTSRPREEFMAEAGLDPGRPYIVYLGSSRNTVKGNEIEFVREWIAALRGSGIDLGILVRPHPNFLDVWREADLGYENAVVWPREGLRIHRDEDALAAFYDTLAFSAAVVGINTTAMIEAAILDKPVLTVIVPGFAQGSTLHFHSLPVENGGFLYTAHSLEEHVGQLQHAVAGDPEDAERRRRFVSSFVRPRGLDRAASEILAEEIEALAAVKVDTKPPLKGRVLHPLLSLEARATAKRERASH